MFRRKRPRAATVGSAARERTGATPSPAHRRGQSDNHGTVRRLRRALPNRRRRLAGVAAATAVVAGAAAPSALAHGIGDSAADKSVLEFVPLGIEHMLLGWDHLLFILGVVILAGTLRRAGKLISVFVVGHSLTLLIATIAGWKLNATLVDVVIALSLVYVGVQGILASRAGDDQEKVPIFARGGPDRNANWTVIGATIFVFGLIHGLGLSTRLQDLGLPDDGLVARVIAFNVGVEIGQLAAITAVVAVGYFIVRAVNWPRVRRGAFVGLVVTGVVAAAVLSFPGGDEEEDAPQAKTPVQQTAACQQGETQPPTTFAGGHPAKRFYGPEEEAPVDDLEHVLGDGYVIVRYRPDLPEQDREDLAEWIAANEQIAGAADPDQDEAVTATTAYRELTCGRFDMRALTEFTETWFADVEAGEFR
jgi:hypothetical protein